MTVLQARKETLREVEVKMDGKKDEDTGCQEAYNFKEEGKMPFGQRMENWYAKPENKHLKACKDVL